MAITLFASSNATCFIPPLSDAWAAAMLSCRGADIMSTRRTDAMQPPSTTATSAAQQVWRRRFHTPLRQHFRHVRADDRAWNTPVTMATNPAATSATPPTAPLALMPPDETDNDFAETTTTPATTYPAAMTITPPFAIPPFGDVEFVIPRNWAPATTAPFAMPPVGGDYDFVIPQDWPSDIVHIDHNLFSASRPYPVVNGEDGTDDPCNCYKCCVSNDGITRASSCVNAATNTVCDDTSCIIGPICGNRFQPQFQLELIETRVGLGVICDTLIPKGSFVTEYVGEVLFADDAFGRTVKRYQAQLTTMATWGGGANIIIDARAYGNVSRFLNHSCHPNCEMYEWNWTNTTRLGIFASRDIPALQELTFDYHSHNSMLFSCACGFFDCVSLRN
jgi:hypothetical protein